MNYAKILLALIILAFTAFLLFMLAIDINAQTDSGRGQSESNIKTQEPSKFSLSTEAAQGFVFKNYHNPQWYSASISVVPRYSLMDNKLFVTEITMAIFSDGLTDYYAGCGVEYKIYEKKDLSYNIQLMASALIGTRDSRLYGGGAKLESGDFYLTVTGRQEYMKKEFYFSGGLGINLF